MLIISSPILAKSPPKCYHLTMIKIKGDLFKQDCDAICIPTNGYIVGDEVIMGGGVAGTAKAKYPQLPFSLAKLIRISGHCTHIITGTTDNGKPFLSYVVPYHIISFPTKPAKIYKSEGWTNVLPRYRPKPKSTKQFVPGWMGYSDLNIIKFSAEELLTYTNARGWKKVCLPMVGAGLGGLKWEEVEKTLDLYLNDPRFIVVERG